MINLMGYTYGCRLMAYAVLEKLAGRAHDDLDRYFEGRPAKLAQSLKDLLLMLATTEVPPDLQQLADSGELHGLPTHLRELQQYLQNDSQLPEAICARYKYKVSETQAIRKYGVSRRAWDYFHNMARQLNWNPDLQVPLIAYEKLQWHDVMEEKFVDMEVLLDVRSLEGMLVSVLEGYLSPRQSCRKGYEVYGINLGMIRDMHHRRFHDGYCITRYVSVMHSLPQLSADAGYNGVAPNEKSFDAILQATSMLYPHCQVVGDFHSHPYDNLSLLEKRGGWTCTDSDERSNIDVAQIMSRHGHRIQLALIIAIARCRKKAPRSHYKGLKNTVQVSIGNCRAIIAAYRSLESGRLTETNTRLRIAGMAS